MEKIEKKNFGSPKEFQFENSTQVFKSKKQKTKTKKPNNYRKTI